MIDNKLNTKSPNLQPEDPLPRQQQKAPKANSQQPHLIQQEPKFQDDVYQQPPKVLRNSSSQYDSVLQKFYKKQQQNDAKSTFKQGKNNREIKQQMSFMIDKSQKGVIAAYFVATKESSSGVFSHQRFFLVDIEAKEIRYYTNIPRLPLCDVQQIAEKPKECIKISQAQKLSISNHKKGIGQIQIRWIQNSETKEWKLKFGNNAMAKQFVILVDSLRTGKSVSVDKKQKIIRELRSPRNKSNSVNKSWVKPRKKESIGSPRDGPSDLSNLLLRSIMNPDQRVIQNNKQKMQKDKQKGVQYKGVQKIKQKVPIVKDNTQNNKTQQNQTIENTNLKERQKGEKVIEQKEDKQTNKVQMSTQYNPPQVESQKIRQAKPQAIVNSLKSIRLEEIIRNASIQYQQQQKRQMTPQIIPISVINIQKPRKSHLETVIQRRKQIEEQSAPTERTVSKQQMPMSKIILQNVHKNTTESRTLELSRRKSIINDYNLKNSTVKEDSYYYQSTAQPKQTIRQNLLQERKYAYTTKIPDRREPKIINAHNHPRKQRSRSSSVNSNIGEYIQKQKQHKENQKDWLFKWLTTQSFTERGNLYKKIVDECSQKVTGLPKKFSSWHLFHKEGEQYIMKEGQIEMQYKMKSSKDIDEYKDNDTAYFRKFNELSYFWNMTGAAKQLSKQYKVLIAPACIVSYKSLRVFCKLDISATKLNFKDVSYSGQYEGLLTEISRKCHSKVKSIQLYQFLLDKKKYLYVQSIQVQPFLVKTLNYYLNQDYVNTYVAGVITLEDHLQKIHQHHQSFIIPQFVVFLQHFTPLSSWQLQAEMQKKGIDLSALPLVYLHCKSERKIRECRFIVSEFCAQIMCESIRRGIHTILLRKIPNKNIEEQIYSLLIRSLRMDDENICEAIQLKYNLSITLEEIKNNIVDQYVITSLLIKLGLKCDLKQEIDLKDLQKLKDLFWQQFQFNQQSISLNWLAQTINYSPIPLHQHASYFQQMFLIKKGKVTENRFDYNRQNLISQLNTPNTSQKKSYTQSWFYLLLNKTQQEKIKSIIAKQQSVLPTVQWQNQLHPFYNLFHQSLAYYITFSSFQTVTYGLRNLIHKREYKNVHNLLEVQLARAWVWGSQNPKILVNILLLKSELSQLMSNEIESIQSILQALQIAIKYYELSAFELQNVLKLCKKAAALHVRYHKYRKAIQFFETCITLFQKAVECNNNKYQLFNSHIKIYNQRARVYLKLGDYQKVEESIKSNMTYFFSWKERFQDEQNDILSTIYKEQFQCYSILFRVYEIRGKLIELVQLMQDFSVKYIQNYLQLLNQSNAQVVLDQQQLYQYYQILKNAWLAVIANSNHAKIPSHQQYFNYYYSPLRNIKLQVIKDILLKMCKMHRGSSPFQKQQSLAQMMTILTDKLKQIKQKEPTPQNKRTKSTLVMGIIDCLSLLSISQEVFLQRKPSHELSELIMLEQIVSILGFQFTIGAIEACINEYNTQL